MIPNRSKSYLLAPQCIISTAQQANPKVIGHIEPTRAQFTSASTVVETNSAPLSALPLLKNSFTDSSGEKHGARGAQSNRGGELRAALVR